MQRAFAMGYRDALEKFAGVVNPGMQRELLDLAGLGLLAVPTAHHLMTADNTKDKALAGTELAGLGVLGVSPLKAIAQHLHR